MLETLLNVLFLLAVGIGGMFFIFQFVKVVTYAYYRAKHSEALEWKNRYRRMYEEEMESEKEE